MILKTRINSKENTYSLTAEDIKKAVDKLDENSKCKQCKAKRWPVIAINSGIYITCINPECPDFHTFVKTDPHAFDDLIQAA